VFVKGNAMVKLREHERETLLATERLGGKASIEEIIGESGLSSAAVMRAVVALQERTQVSVAEKKQTSLTLTDEGTLYANRGLPERRVLDALPKEGLELPISKITKEAGIPQSSIPLTLGWLVRKKWAVIDEKRTKIKALFSHEAPPIGNDEKLLQILKKKEALAAEDLSPEMQAAVNVLKRRNLLKTEEKTRRIIELTEAGWKTIKQGVEATSEVTQLKPEFIVTGKWREVKLQRYDIEAPVAKNWPGKKHPYLQFLDEVKQKLVTLGFREMIGPTVEASFFNFDALYMPQDHPAREIFGIYLVKSPKYANLSSDRNVIKNVKETHENGWKTGSTGWRYRYSVKEAERLILRGHGTCQSVRTLLSKNLEIPGRYFSVVRCYRPEVVDKTHLTEFDQVEGIVVDKDLTLRDLLGILKQFAVEIAGADRVKFRPDYFPFTEPSVELTAYRKGCGWIEFGGSGIFRPEVTLPLGIEEPVLAWGLGLNRLYMMRAGIDDIRKIFSQNLDWIRTKEVV
jgi:phenylalanyl-tRNA synthetase alpha chain